MVKEAIKKRFLLSAAITVVSLFVLSFITLSAQAGQESRTITLEDVDSSKDGVVSKDEAKIFLEKLNDEYAAELERQRLEVESQENERRQNEEKRKNIVKTVKLHPADIDKNGIISPEEYAAYSEKMKTLASKKAGIDDSSTMDDKEKKIPEFLQKKYDRRMEEMKGFDKNKDGILQAEELQSSAGTKFDTVDANKDGILSPEETAASLEKFKANKQEAYGEAAVKQQANRMKNRLKNADTNDDEKVSKEEYNAYMAKHQQNFDRNGDGVISKEEYRTDGEKLPSSYIKKPKED